VLATDAAPVVPDSDSDAAPVVPDSGSSSNHTPPNQHIYFGSDDSDDSESLGGSGSELEAELEVEVKPRQRHRVPTRAVGGGQLGRSYTIRTQRKVVCRCQKGQ
jgi:hypothetical protein